MKKTKLFNAVFGTAVIFSFTHFQVNGQTQASGSITNTAVPTAGTAGTNRCFMGAGAGNSNGATGNYNSFFGEYSGYLNDNGDNNSFFGYQAGYSNAAHTYGGRDHVFVGYQAGYNSDNV